MNLGQALAAVIDEHRRCGELDNGLTSGPEGYRVWLSCSVCGRFEWAVRNLTRKQPGAK